MFCQNCGKEVSNESKVCVHCGSTVHGGGASSTTRAANPEHDESKTFLGVILALFIGVIGLVIGIVMYPEGTVARKTFIKGWLIAFFVSMGISVLLGILAFALTFFLPLILGTGEYLFLLI